MLTGFGYVTLCSSTTDLPPIFWGSGTAAGPRRRLIGSSLGAYPSSTKDGLWVV